MIKDGKYRFSLQFASDSDNQIRAGEFLERLGNRKSCIIVEAINEYIDNHPELENTQRKIEIKINSSSAYSKEKIEQMIRVLVEEKLSLIQASNGAQKDGETTVSETMDRDIATMLDNIKVDYIALGKNIKKYRRFAGLRQIDLAEKTGYSDSYIGQIENARTTPSLEAIVAIANTLSVTVDQLLVKDSRYPDKVYLKDISDRIEKYSVSKKIFICEAIVNLLDNFEKYDSLK